MSAAHAAVHLPLTAHPKWPQTNLTGISNWEIKVLPPLLCTPPLPTLRPPTQAMRAIRSIHLVKGEEGIPKERGGGTNVPGGNRNAGSPDGSTLATTSAQCEASESRLNANKLYSHTIYEIRYTIYVRYTVYDILIWTSRNTEKKASLFIFSRGVNEAVLGIFNLMTFDYYYFYYAGHLLGSARLGSIMRDRGDFWIFLWL